ncbi:PTS sugar transporter subunit IIA, partial [Gilliamella apicola]|uniref:PTS sugar transporter subunit IIA n=1 Tax=Gilliamella apicola TaxID=1196095 RepID=UPI000A0DA5BB
MELEQLDDNIIFLNKNFSSREDMFKSISHELLDNNYVTEQYLEKVIQRENV